MATIRSVFTCQKLISASFKYTGSSYKIFWNMSFILISLASAAGAAVVVGAVSYQNHIRFPLGMHNYMLDV